LKVLRVQLEFKAVSNLYKSEEFTPTCFNRMAKLNSIK
jgi:hypothetical protein